MANNADLQRRKLFSKGFRSWRISQKLSQVACASRLQISLRYVRMLDKGERVASSDLLARAARVTQRGCCCALGMIYCPQRAAGLMGGLSATA